jgi:hypothetical protein
MSESQQNTCQHCKYIMWLIGVGQGLRCANQKNKDMRWIEREGNQARVGPLLPSRNFTCENFEKEEPQAEKK